MSWKNAPIVFNEFKNPKSGKGKRTQAAKLESGNDGADIKLDVKDLKVPDGTIKPLVSRFVHPMPLPLVI